MARKRKNQYFTKVHEQAILDYCLTNDPKTRNELYNTLIGPAFNEMVDKIVYTYKFTNLPNIDYLKEDCKNWLVTILDKYDANRGSKAFSYFSVITKNWFIHKVKKTSQQYRREVLIEKYCISNDEDINNNHPLVIYNTSMQDAIKKEFWGFFKEHVDVWETQATRPNDKKVIQAVKILFEESENIEIFNKKAIYLYIREITGLNTKQVVSSLNKIRVKYRDFKKKWDDE
tara:strand:- start:47901 stop:48590 length:690 start_codon:yes stop_codon:yes gene_type:complete